MAMLKQSTAYTRMFKMVESADHITALTGATCTVNLSKAGGSFGAAGGSVTEVANGWYKVALTTTDTGTLGDLAYYITATSGDTTDFVDQVTANILGDTLPANTTQFGGTSVTGRDLGASVLLSSGTGTGQLSLSSGLVTLAGVTHTGAVIPTVTNLTNAAGAGDFTSTMKTSLNAATPASVQNIPVNADTYVNVHVKATDNIDFTALEKTSLNAATPASVTTVTGNVNGSVGSVTAAVSITGDLSATMKTSVTTAATAATPTIAAYTGDTPQTGDVYGLLTGADSELASSPSVTASLVNKLRWLFQYFKLKRTVTATTETIFKNDGSTSLSTNAISDDGTTFTKGAQS